LAAVASRSSLVGALLRISHPQNRPGALNFLRGLSRDELECLAEFHGAWTLEAEASGHSNPYRVMEEFFSASCRQRWQSPEIRAHRWFVVLAWLDQLQYRLAIRIQPEAIRNEKFKQAAV